MHFFWFIEAMKDISIYSGAGNDFVVLDWRGQNGGSGGGLDGARIRELCAEHGTDGLMLLREGSGCDFRMEYFNSDGSGGMMCGNGGRCIVAFAASLGIEPARDGVYLFEAADGLHRAEILAQEGSGCTVRLSMTDPSDIRPMCVEGRDGWFINTGTRHFVTFVQDSEAVDVETEGARLRHSSAFAPEGANINFVQRLADGRLRIRTFEKGVEAETLACGTGITAAAIIDSLDSAGAGINALAEKETGSKTGNETGTIEDHGEDAAELKRCETTVPAKEATGSKSHTTEVGTGNAATEGRATEAGNHFRCRILARCADLSVDFLIDRHKQPREVFLTGPAERIR